jgi:hypothetical protein
VHLVHEDRRRTGLLGEPAERVRAHLRVGGVAQAERDVGEGDLDDEVAFDPVVVAQQGHGVFDREDVT